MTCYCKLSFHFLVVEFFTVHRFDYHLFKLTCTSLVRLPLWHCFTPPSVSSSISHLSNKWGAVHFTSDPDFWMSLVNTVLLSAGKLLVEIPLALLLATLLNQKLRIIGFFRVTLFMPAVISAAIIGLIFSLLFAAFNGTVNTMLQSLGLISRPINWFGTKGTAMFVLGVASVWQNYGINMMFFLMALQSIPQEIYECAELDGARGLRKFFSITLPMIAPVFESVLLMAIIGSLKVCDLVISLTNGQPGGSTEVIMTYIYKFFLVIRGEISRLAMPPPCRS